MRGGFGGFGGQAEKYDGEDRLVFLRRVSDRAQEFASGDCLESGRCVAEEFVVDEDFGAVEIRGNSDGADAIGGGR